jgi:hypothetical protein
MIRDTELLAVELWLGKRLTEHGVPLVTRGVTTANERRERIRQGIVDNGLSAVIVGRNPKDRKPETYAQLFERVYGMRLNESRGDI